MNIDRDALSMETKRQYQRLTDHEIPHLSLYRAAFGLLIQIVEEECKDEVRPDSAQRIRRIIIDFGSQYDEFLQPEFRPELSVIREAFCRAVEKLMGTQS